MVSSLTVTSLRFTAPISLNAAIFASVILVSRLPSVLHVFGIMIIAIELFALFPYLRRSVKVSLPSIFPIVFNRLIWQSYPITPSDVYFLCFWFDQKLLSRRLQLSSTWPSRGQLQRWRRPCSPHSHLPSPSSTPPFSYLPPLFPLLGLFTCSNIKSTSASIWLDFFTHCSC